MPKQLSKELKAHTLHAQKSTTTSRQQTAAHNQSKLGNRNVFNLEKKKTDRLTDEDNKNRREKYLYSRKTAKRIVEEINYGTYKMGNVLAAVFGTEDNESSTAAISRIAPQPAGHEYELAASETVKKVKLRNPGTVEDLHKKCKDVQPLTFEGAKIMVNKVLSNHFHVWHVINISDVRQSGYRFGATYAGTQEYDTVDATYPLILGDIDPAGNMNANIVHQFTSRLRCKFASQIQNSQMTASQLTTDYYGTDYTTSLTLGHPNIFNNSCLLVAHYLQALSDNLALGAELAYQCGPNVAGQQVALVTGLGRYTRGNSICACTLGLTNLHLSYYQRASSQLKIGVEVEANLRLQQAVATIAYQVDLPKAELIFRGSIDSSWSICGVLEKRLQPLPLTFVLSAGMNHVKNNFKVGCGLVMG